jgi:inorganic triphosphatase YgiF
MTETVERELKLVPTDAGMLDLLAHVERLGPLSVTGRRHELQRNSFFDTRARTLGLNHVGFRRRTVPGKRLARWTIKGDSDQASKGVATRSEIELQLDQDMPPALALGVLADAARSRGASALVEAVVDAQASGGLPLAEPFIETETDRTILDLEAPERGWAVELALDRMQVINHRYADLEIEAELKRGDIAALDAAREAIEGFGEVSESEGSKLSRAIAHVVSCDCAPN